MYECFLFTFLEEERMGHYGDDNTEFSPEIFLNI